MSHTTPIPGQPAPSLTVEALGGKAIDIAADRPKNFTVVFFYRGLHCPICRKQLEELNEKLDAFDEIGVTAHVVSMDEKERAEKQKAEWSIGNLSIGFGLTEKSAREWGLFMSQKEQDAEPDRFAEPGIAVIKPDGTLYSLHLQNVPFARPTIDGLVEGLSFIIENDYPIRGKLAA
ncbi:redoxin domain-containing protein [Fulvimarina sp. 2208YS6-2-32]|uniref:Redoxin domain-containing protein n=1 Tax=Fulvimarina uroteuthidis TaxID=3098149 RepID=A0ABU5I7M5_9HYPH|nr:redoxin domain-containing protein [Fulvimarina sp. 2208YS6-2-32]MDY8111117.1 redoxin domain-containing protein [Fulvimarina sp. 2208YS6-2-32]